MIIGADTKAGMVGVSAAVVSVLKVVAENETNAARLGLTIEDYGVLHAAGYTFDEITEMSGDDRAELLARDGGGLNQTEFTLTGDDMIPGMPGCDDADVPAKFKWIEVDEQEGTMAGPSSCLLPGYEPQRSQIVAYHNGKGWQCLETQPNVDRDVVSDATCVEQTCLNQGDER